MKLHREFGIPLEEWIEKIPNELEMDCVGLWQLTGAFERGFGLEGPDLELAMKSAVEGLLGRGALPVVSPYLEGALMAREDLMSDGRGDVQKIIVHWRSLDHSPSFEDIWFDVPRREV